MSEFDLQTSAFSGNENLHILCRNCDLTAYRTLQQHAATPSAETTVSHPKDPYHQLLARGYLILTHYVCEVEAIPCHIDEIQSEAKNVYPLLLQSYDLTDPSIVFLCGIFQYYGLGCNKDLITAVKNLKISCQSGFVLAQCCLGNYYYSQPLPDDEEAHKSDEKAFELYSLAALQNYSIAQYNLGLCYENGCGVIINPEKAIELYHLSASQGNVAAQYHLAAIYESGQFCSLSSLSSNQFPLLNLNLAYEYYSLAAKGGCALAQYNLGICYEYGLNKVLDKDYEIASDWYSRSAQQGHPPSQYALGQCYEYGKGVDKDLSCAVKWYLQAAANGHLGGQFRCGWSYQFGQGVSQDLNEAMRFYEMIADTNNSIYVKDTTATGNSSREDPPLMTFRLDENALAESSEDRIHRALGMRNLSICLEEMNELKMRETRAEESGREGDVNKMKLMRRIYELSCLAEYLLEGDKRNQKAKERRLQLQVLLKGW
jgi:TPR repeat protein